LQSAFSDHFEKDHITLVGLFLQPGFLAAGLPGFGPAYAERVDSMRHLAVFGGLIHDEDKGRVHRFFGPEPVITYKLSRRDKAAMIRAIAILSETFFAAGAKEIYLPVFGMPPLRGVDDVR